MKFFVGQRVRVVGNYPRVRGAEGVVNEIGCETMRGEPGVGVTLSICPLRDGYTCRDWCFPPDWLEPIIPDGHRAGEEGTCEPLDKLLSEVTP